MSLPYRIEVSNKLKKKRDNARSLREQAIGNMSKQNILKNIVQKVIEEAIPEKIILFGSRAKEEQTKESDYDICVLKKGVLHKRKLAQRIYLTLDVNVPVDVIVETPEKFNELKNNPFLIYYDIAKYGRVVYEK